MPVLYGDGIHDDAPAIQAMLDSGASAVQLPVPQKEYCIGTTLYIHSGQTLTLPETTVIRLLPCSSCFMLRNATQNDHDICVSGGIWDYDNVRQAGNPVITGRRKVKNRPTHRDGNPDTVVTYLPDGADYTGVIMRFFGVTRLSIHGITFKDPVTYCLQIAYAKYFTVENVRFDQNLGNPTAENMDGVHIDGGCRFGSIRNVQGTCYDDVVALNADDGCDGPIEDITVDGVYGENSLRGVRLLSIKSDVARITVQRVYGTFYQNCVGLTYFYPRSGVRGKMSHIVLRDLFGENAPRKPQYRKGKKYAFSFVWIDGDLDIDRLSIENLMRRERVAVVETLKVCQNCRIGTLSVRNAEQRNETGTPFPMITVEGEIGKLYLSNVDAGSDTLLENRGSIGKLIEE